MDTFGLTILQKKVDIRMSDRKSNELTNILDTKFVKRKSRSVLTEEKSINENDYKTIGS